jgi:spermidine synthase
MPEIPEPAAHVKPFVHESLSSKALHFSVSEIQSRMQIQDPLVLDLEYTRLMMGFLLFEPAPREIVMIGLGGGSLAKFCHRHLPKAHIQVVEINPHVITLRDEFHVPPDSPRLRVVCDDGARFVRHCATRCDIVLVDGFDSDGQPAGLSSQRFYDDCFDLLQPGGIMVVNLHCGHPRFETYMDRIRRSFGHAVLQVDGVELGNSVVLARKGQAFPRVPPGMKRIARTAARQLQQAFACVATALADQTAELP